MNLFVRQLGVAAVAALCVNVVSQRVHADPEVVVEVDIDVFHDDLAPHGEWFVTDVYGPVWTPHHMPHDWHPYTVGHWEFTDDHGWLWVSDYDWGWAPFHYGRWVYDDFHGWLWVPDTEWGPAWVAWREGGGHVGWAPLPPQVRWEVGVGLGSGGFDINVQIHPRCWSFVEERYILDPRLQVHSVAPARKIVLLRKTTDATRYLAVDGRVVNRGLSVERVERTIGRRVPRRTIRVMDSTATTRRVHVSDGQINLYRPKVVRRVDPNSPGKTTMIRRKLSTDGMHKHGAASKSVETVRREASPSAGGAKTPALKATRANNRDVGGKRSASDSGKTVRRRKAAESDQRGSVKRSGPKRAPRPKTRKKP